MTSEHLRPGDSTPGGRRAAHAPRRWGALGVATLGVPLLTVGALAMVNPAQVETGPRTPTAKALDRSVVVCPSGVAGGLPPSTVRVANADGVEGPVTVYDDAGESRLAVAGSTQQPAVGALSVAATGQMAPGLVAAVAGDTAGTACQRPDVEAWFTGVGAGAEHSSVLELVNPDAGTAVADVVVHGPDGVIDVPKLRGVSLVAHSSGEFDLAELVPIGDELSLHVTVTRGRLGVFVRDRVDQLGRGPSSSDWLAGATAPAPVNHLLGLGGGRGERTLVVTNPSPDEARVQLKVRTAGSEFVPTEASELRVPPGAVRSVDVSRLVPRGAGDPLGALVTLSEVPVLATVRSVIGGHLTQAVAGANIAERALPILPGGERSLVLAVAQEPATVTWTTYDEDGAKQVSRTVEVVAGRARIVALPGAADLLGIEVVGGDVQAAVEAAQGRGRVTMGLRELVVSSLVPDVAPAHSSGDTADSTR